MVRGDASVHNRRSSAILPKAVRSPFDIRKLGRPMADVVANSISDLPHLKIRQGHPLAFKTVRFSFFAVAYLIAYGYGNFSQTMASPLWFPDSVLLCAL